MTYEDSIFLVAIMVMVVLAISISIDVSPERICADRGGRWEVVSHRYVLHRHPMCVIEEEPVYDCVEADE